MKFVYNESEIVGKFLIKYNILFESGIAVEVKDEKLIRKLIKSPYLSVEEDKPKRKYNKKPKVEENETQDEPQAEAETTPETEVEDEAE